MYIKKPYPSPRTSVKTSTSIHTGHHHLHNAVLTMAALWPLLPRVIVQPQWTVPTCSAPNIYHTRDSFAILVSFPGSVADTRKSQSTIITTILITTNWSIIYITMSWYTHGLGPNLKTCETEAKTATGPQAVRAKDRLVVLISKLLEILRRV